MVCAMPAAVVEEQKDTPRLAATGAASAAPRGSSSVPSEVRGDPPCTPSLVRGLGSGLESNGRDGNGVGRTAKLTRSLQKDAEYYSHGFIDRNA